MRIATAPLHPCVVPIGLVMLIGCASSSSPPQPVTAKGTSGPVTWEIADVGQLTSPDNNRLRWSYVIVLREAAGSAVQFDRVERRVRSTIEMIGGSAQEIPFARTMAAHGELRYPTTETWGWTRESGREFGGAGTIPPLTVEHRFTGRTDGRPIEVTAHVHLDRSVGKKVAPTISTSGSLSPARTLQPSDLGGLAGRWQGSFRADGDVFDVPVVFVIGSDGSVEVTTNDPVTHRFRATLSVRDGQLVYAGTPETGQFELHEQAGQRILAGYVSAPPQGSQSPVRYALRLRWQGL